MDQLDVTKVTLVVNTIESLGLGRGGGGNSPLKILGGQLGVVVSILAKRGC